MDWPVPPWLLSRLIRSNDPGDPSLARGSVVGLLKQGQPAPLRNGCVFLTTIGATPLACAGTKTRAVAEAPMLTLRTPAIRLKKPSFVLWAWTVIVSLAISGPEVTEMSPAATPPS